MGKIGGFKEFNRADEGNIAVVERVANYNEFTIALPKDKIKEMYPARKKYYSDEFLNQSENLISNAIYSKTQFSFSLYKKIFK